MLTRMLKYLSICNIAFCSLLNAQAAKKNTGVKRRWDDDVVFKNCARQVTLLILV